MGSLGDEWEIERWWHSCARRVNAMMRISLFLIWIGLRSHLVCNSCYRLLDGWRHFFSKPQVSSHCRFEKSAIVKGVVPSLAEWEKVEDRRRERGGDESRTGRKYMRKNFLKIDAEWDALPLGSWYFLFAHYFFVLALFVDLSWLNGVNCAYERSMFEPSRLIEQWREWDNESEGLAEGVKRGVVTLIRREDLISSPCLFLSNCQLLQWFLMFPS